MKYRSGVTTYVGNTASGTQVIAHGLGQQPKRVTMKAFKTVGSASTAYSEGEYDEGGASCIFQTSVNAGAGIAGNSASQILVIKDSGASNTQEATISVDATNITLTWTKNASPSSDNIQELWAAEC